MQTSTPTHPAAPRDPGGVERGSAAAVHAQLPVDRPESEGVVAEAARRMATAPRPLDAWREVSRTGALPGNPDPDGTAAGLVRHWHQHLAVAIDEPMERLEPGEDRLPALVTAWLDVARRTSLVRAHIAATAGPRATVELQRQTALLAWLLAEDLALMGTSEPRRSALDLLGELTAVAAAEDAAGRELPSARRALLGNPEPTPPSWREWLACLLRRPAAA